MVQCVRAAWSRSVVSRHLVSKHIEGMAVGIHECWCEARRGESPLVVVWSWCWIGVLYVGLRVAIGWSKEKRASAIEGNNIARHYYRHTVDGMLLRIDVQGGYVYQ